jgi:hypothetical protein
MEDRDELLISLGRIYSLADTIDTGGLNTKKNRHNQEVRSAILTWSSEAMRVVKNHDLVSRRPT